MSRSVLYVFGADGKVATESEYSNGWGYAMPVWNWLADRYLPGNKTWFIDGKGAPVFNLRDDPSLEDWERICLMASFDWAIVRKERFPDLVSAFRTAQDRIRGKHPAHVCHYGPMADRIEALANHPVMAVAWLATSVSESLWWVYDDCTCTCGDVHKVQEGRAYNILADTSHWDVFEEIAKGSKCPTT